jgi:hypothetical protein
MRASLQITSQLADEMIMGAAATASTAVVAASLRFLDHVKIGYVSQKHNSSRADIFTA